jgi:hypothetical protein
MQRDSPLIRVGQQSAKRVVGDINCVLFVVALLSVFMDAEVGC